MVVLNNQVSKSIGFLTGFCSILYILFFGEVLFALYESTQVFSLILGVFLLGIFIGSKYIKKIKHSSDNFFLLTEFSIPIIAILNTALLLFLFYQSSSLFINLAIVSIFVLCIGVLSGFEGELILKHNKKMNLKKITQYQLAGVIFGSILFSLFILPFFDLLSSLVIVGFFNTLIAAIYVIIRDRTNKTFKFDFGEVATILLLVGYIILASFVPELTNFVEMKLFGGL